MDKKLLFIFVCLGVLINFCHGSREVNKKRDLTLSSNDISSGYEAPAAPAPFYGYANSVPAAPPKQMANLGYYKDPQSSVPGMPPQQQGYGYPAPAPQSGYPAPETTTEAPQSGYDSAPLQNSGYDSRSPQNPGHDLPPSPNPGYNSPPSQSPGYNSPPSQSPGYNSPPAPSPPAPPPPPPKTNYGYGQGAGNLPSITTNGVGGGDSGSAGAHPTRVSTPVDPIVTPAIDYVLIPLIFVGICGPILSVVYVVMGIIDNKMNPAVRRSLDLMSAYDHTALKNTTDAIMTAVSRALDKHQCWERMACAAGSFFNGQGMSQLGWLEKSFDPFIPKTYHKEYRTFAAALRNSNEDCSVFKCFQN